MVGRLSWRMGFNMNLEIAGWLPVVSLVACVVDTVSALGEDTDIPAEFVPVVHGHRKLAPCRLLSWCAACPSWREPVGHIRGLVDGTGATRRVRVEVVGLAIVGPGGVPRRERVGARVHRGGRGVCHRMDRDRVQLQRDQSIDKPVTRVRQYVQLITGAKA